MLSGIIISKLNATIQCGIPKTITQQQVVQTSLYRNSVLSLSSLHPTTPFCSPSHTKSKATPTSNAVLGDRNHRVCFLRVSENLRRSQPLLYLYCPPFRSYTYDASFLHGPWLKNFTTSSSARYSAEAAHDVSFEVSPSDEQYVIVIHYSIIYTFQIIHVIVILFIEADVIFTTSVGGKNLKLFSGSCYLPHPDKEETGGEDAHFICTDEQAIGVADGVGSWADVGVNAGLFAKELISNAVRAIQEEPKGSFINPARVLEKAHSSSKAKGSSTACIISLTDGVIYFFILSFDKLAKESCSFSVKHINWTLGELNLTCMSNAYSILDGFSSSHQHQHEILIWL
ncbi:hypothetical protein RIF29_37238 [Crotalaria pallida]|uniref:Protein phosphatase n=1 Tax=Crotalaria pallida TaxID=3830 RepID=A0AAN9EE74_CROPI